MDSNADSLPPKLSELRPRRLAAATVVTVAVALSAWVLFRFNPSDSPFYPVCQFHALTGLNCPGCGSLRALHELVHGNLAAAFRFNALLALSLPAACWLGGRHVLRWFKNQPATIAIRPAWMWGGLVVMLLFGVLRNLPFDCLAWLGP
jgi:hypothetical protein